MEQSRERSSALSYSSVGQLTTCLYYITSPQLVSLLRLHLNLCSYLSNLSTTGRRRLNSSFSSPRLVSLPMLKNLTSLANYPWLERKQMDSCLPQKNWREVIRKQLRSEFEIEALISFSILITVSLTEPPFSVSSFTMPGV